MGIEMAKKYRKKKKRNRVNIELNGIIMDEKIRKKSEDYDECNELNVECKRR